MPAIPNSLFRVHIQAGIVLFLPRRGALWACGLDLNAVLASDINTVIDKGFQNANSGFSGAIAATM